MVQRRKIQAQQPPFSTTAVLIVYIACIFQVGNRETGLFLA